MASLKEWLANIGCDEALEIMLSTGFDSIDFLCTLDDDEVKTLSDILTCLRPAKRLRILNQVRLLRLSGRQVGPDVGNGRGNELVENANKATSTSPTLKVQNGLTASRRNSEHRSSLHEPPLAPEEAENSEDFLIIQRCRILSPSLKPRALKAIDELILLQEAQEFYNKQLTHDDHWALRQTIDACSRPGGSPASMDIYEFERCHKAIGQIIGQAGFVFSSEPLGEFNKAHLEGGNCLSSAEIADWLRKIFKDIKGDRFPIFYKFLYAVQLRCRAIREIEKFIRVMELQESMALYGKAYRELKGQPGYKDIPSDMPSSDLEQPPCNDLKELYEQTPGILKKVEALGEEVRVYIGAPFWSMGPLKKEFRSKEKVEKDYGGNVRRLLDVVRFSVACYDLDMVRKAIDFVSKRKDVKIERIKSGFNPEAGSAVTQNGYRDVKVNCSHKHNGHIFEIQLHVLNFYSLKRELGHDLYTWARQFPVDGIVNATDVLDNLSPELLEEMSSVARIEMDVVLQDRGDCVQAMQWRIALAQISKITNHEDDRSICLTLYNMIETQDDHAATSRDLSGFDIAEIKLLVGRSKVFDVDESLKICWEALNLITQIPEADQTPVEALFIARACHAIGSCYFFRGKQPKKTEDNEELHRDMKLALENYEKAIQIFNRHLLPHHPIILSIEKNRGGTLTELQRASEAITHLRKVTDTIITNLGDYHLQTGKACFELGKALQQNRMFTDATAFLERSLSIRIRNVGKDHVSVAKGYLQLGKCKHAAGDNCGALRDTEKASALYSTSNLKRKRSSVLHGMTAISAKELDEATVLLEKIKKSVETPTHKQPLFVSTLNFLGNAYNPMEFMNSEPSFQKNYPRVKEAFEMLLASDVVAEATNLGFEADLAKILSSRTFAEHCTKEFLKRDNKLDLSGRTNMVVAGMMPLEEKSNDPHFRHVLDWRKLMRQQAKHYSNDPQLVAWDIACNLAAERSVREYQELSEGSYLNPECILRNVQTLLEQLPTDREFVCAVQEFPEEGPKFTALTSELRSKGWRSLTPGLADTGVGFLISETIKVLKATHAPLGLDPAKIYAELGFTDFDRLADSDKASLKTTARKTYVVDVAASERRPAIRFINVHAKEFKTEEGTKLLAKYIRALAHDPDGRGVVVLTDANTPSRDKTKVLCAEFLQQGLEVISPESALYITTRKQRSKMHGQYYDEKKCLQVVEAHKTYAAILQPSAGYKFIVRENARFHPDLRFTDENLPSPSWPSDHCMLFADLYAAKAE